MNTILIFGDSITWGAIDYEKGGWVERLKVYMGENYDIDVYNLGVSGDKTPDLLERFESETTARIEEDEEVVLIFAVGINDSYFVHSKNDIMTPPEKFKENIQKLTGLAQKFSSKVVFVGLTPVDEPKTTPIPWNTDKSYKNENIKKYNGVIKNICNEQNVPFVDIFDRWIELDYKNLLTDGLHPNSKGHQEIYETVKNFLIQNKITKN